jgi:hypothetical protein
MSRHTPTKSFVVRFIYSCTSKGSRCITYKTYHSSVKVDCAAPIITDICAYRKLAPAATDVGQVKSTFIGRLHPADAVVTTPKKTTKNNSDSDKNFFIFPPPFLIFITYAPYQDKDPWEKMSIREGF